MNRVETNENGGFFSPGKPLSTEKKLEIAAILERHRQEGTNRPNLSAIARQTCVSEGSVRKVERELFLFGSVQAPQKAGTSANGPGALTLSHEDERVLLRLLRRDCFRSLRSYRRCLYKKTGTQVSEATISRFFTKGFQIKGNLCKPDMIPIDKFKADNLQRFFEYAAWIRRLPAHRLKFADEKHLKGSEAALQSAKPYIFRIPSQCNEQ